MNSYNEKVFVNAMAIGISLLAVYVLFQTLNYMATVSPMITVFRSLFTIGLVLTALYIDYKVWW